MTTVVTDLAERSVADLQPGWSSTADIESIIRMFSVTGLTDASADARIHSAITASGIPGIGDQHPTATTLRVASVRATMVGPTQATVEVAYTVLSDRMQLKLGIITKLVSWRSSTVSLQTTKDSAGTVMAQTYVGGAWVFDLTKNTRTETTGQDYYYFKTDNLSLQKPVAVATYTKWVTSITATDITSIVGRVNDAVWSGYAAKTFLCEAVSAEKDIGGYFLTFDLAYNPDTWRYESRVTDPQGLEPPDIAVANGITTYDIYPSAAFGTYIGSSL